MISGHHAPEGAKGVGKGMDESAEPGSIRLRLDISYDGTDFSGWAIQPDRRTVAGTLTDALQVLLRHPVQLVVAGRTDAGVHASGQVAHVDVDTDALLALTPRRRPGAPDDVVNLQADLPADLASGLPADLPVASNGLLRRLAGVLPPDVRVRAVAPAAPSKSSATPRSANCRRSMPTRVSKPATPSRPAMNTFSKPVDSR